MQLKEVVMLFIKLFSIILTLIIHLSIIAVVLVVLVFAVRVMIKIWNILKTIFIYMNFKKIKEVKLYPPYETYKKVYEQIGYSYSTTGHYREYFKVRRIPAGKERKAKIIFEFNFPLTIYLNENSNLYKKIISSST